MKINSFIESIKEKTNTFAFSLLGLMLTKKASAGSNITSMDLTQDLSGGKTIEDVAQQGANTIGLGASLMLLVFTLIGIVVFGISLFKLYKASDENSRAGYGGPILGLIIGGLMTSVGVLVWISKSAVLR